MWPLIRERNPAVSRLLDAMTADHRAIVPAIAALTAAAQQYRSAEGDGPRLELVQAVDALTDVLLPHLDREVRGAMPVVALSISARDFQAWNQQLIKQKSPWELGIQGHWLIDEIDPEDYRLVVRQVPAVPRFILLHAFARPYRRRRDAWWNPDLARRELIAR